MGAGAADGGAAIKAEICDRCCHKQGTGTFHLSAPMCDLPRVHRPRRGSVCRASHPHQPYQTSEGFKSKRGGEGKEKTKTNDVLSASKNPLHNPHLSL